MTNRSNRGSGQPEWGHALRARTFDWDPIRARHQGQRPSAPRKQAGHMTAPDRTTSKQQKNPCHRGPSTYDPMHPEMGMEDDGMCRLRSRRSGRSSPSRRSGWGRGRRGRRSRALCRPPARGCRRRASPPAPRASWDRHSMMRTWPFFTAFFPGFPGLEAGPPRPHIGGTEQRVCFREHAS